MNAVLIEYHILSHCKKQGLFSASFILIDPHCHQIMAVVMFFILPPLSRSSDWREQHGGRARQNTSPCLQLPSDVSSLYPQTSVGVRGVSSEASWEKFSAKWEPLHWESVKWTSFASFLWGPVLYQPKLRLLGPPGWCPCDLTRATEWCGERRLPGKAWTEAQKILCPESRKSHRAEPAGVVPEAREVHSNGKVCWESWTVWGEQARVG